MCLAIGALENCGDFCWGWFRGGRQIDYIMILESIAMVSVAKIYCRINLKSKRNFEGQGNVGNSDEE